jgi:hypothetical protein
MASFDLVFENSFAPLKEQIVQRYSCRPGLTGFLLLWAITSMLSLRKGEHQRAGVDWCIYGVNAVSHFMCNLGTHLLVHQ